MRRRLLHRVPVRIRHYWKLLAGCVAFGVALAVVFSTVRIQPYVISASDRTGDRVTLDLAGRVDLFDASRAHSLRLTFRDKDYQRMLDEYFGAGGKDYVEADLTVDGTVIPSVGIRLKGNSTLGGLTRNGESRGDRRGGPGRSSLAAEEPENLPWLIRFDEFVDGRAYQGHREIAVRVAGMRGGPTVLNEAVSLDALAAAGEISQRYSYTSFTVNDRPTTARLIVEHPDENFADGIGGRGVLYKSLAGSQFVDQGDDQTAYQDDFDQITRKGSQDLRPVIDLIRWVHGSGDEEFAEELDEHVDVASFARYAAWQNLLLNFDDMAGPGRNYYLWYDLGTRRFSVVGWDHNLTFSGDPAQGPHESGRMGGGFPGGGGPPAGAEPAPPPEMAPPVIQDGGGRPGGGGFSAGHRLKERFLAAPAFREIYEDAYRTLYRQTFANGTALAVLDRTARVLSTVEGADPQTTAADAEELRAVIQQRTTSLAADPVIAGR